MHDSVPVGRAPDAGLRAVYFGYFAFVGGFTPFLSLWLAHLGWSVAIIGVLVSIPSLMRIVGPSFWGELARRSGHRVRWIRLSALFTLLLVSLLHWVGASLPALAFVFVLLFFATAAQGPITEALALAATRGEPGHYGRIRLWGSIGFIAAVLALGPALDALGIAYLPLLALGLALVLSASALGLREPGFVQAPAPAGGLSMRDRLKEPKVRAFFASAALMVFAHSGLYALFSLYLETHGYSKSLIGGIWAIGVLAEIALFRWQQPVFARFAVGQLLVFSVLVAAFRFAGVAWSEGSLVWIVLTQLTHAITFGVHHSACMQLLHRWFDERQQPAAQALFTTISYGCGGTLGGLSAGYIWSAVSPSAVFWLGSVAALASAVVLLRALRE